MANKKIEDLTAITGTVGTADIFELSVWTGSAFVSRKVTFNGIETSLSSSNIGTDNLTINSSLITRTLKLGGNTSSDGFAIQKLDGTNILQMYGDGRIYSSGGGTGARVTAFGEEAGQGSGNNNALFGYRAGYVMTTGNNNTVQGAYSLDACTTGYYNTAIGYSSLGGLTTAFQNTALGYRAGLAADGNKNTFIGYDCGTGVTSGYQNTFLGGNVGGGVTTGFNNVMLNKGSASNTGITNGISNVIIGNITGLAGGTSTSVYIGDTSASGTTAIVKDANHNVYFSDNTALATTATNGFVYVRGGAGTPTGTPATSITGHVPLYADTTNNKLYIYSGGSWVALN
jgi:hypothetical protein